MVADKLPKFQGALAIDHDDQQMRLFTNLT